MTELLNQPAISIVLGGFSRHPVNLQDLVHSSGFGFVCDKFLLPSLFDLFNCVLSISKLSSFLTISIAMASVSSVDSFGRSATVCVRVSSYADRTVRDFPIPTLNIIFVFSLKFIPELLKLLYLILVLTAVK